MRTTTAIVEIFSDPLSGAFVGGWALLILGALLSVPAMIGIGIILLIGSIATAMGLTLR